MNSTTDPNISNGPGFVVPPLGGVLFLQAPAEAGTTNFGGPGAPLANNGGPVKGGPETPVRQVSEDASPAPPTEESPAAEGPPSQSGLCVSGYCVPSDDEVPVETRETRRRSKRYHRQRMLLSLADTVAEAALLVVLAAAGLSVAVRAWAQPHAGNPWALVALYLVPLGALFGAVSMASSAVHTFLIDRRFGLSTQSVAAWFIDGVKGFLVSGLLGLGAIEILYALLRRFPETWWIWTAAVFSLLLVFLAQLAPVLIFPIFFKFKKIKDEEIVARLQRLAERAGTRVAGIYEMNLSRKTRAVNAALAGFGRTRRIIMADTLLDRFSLDEIEAIMAHEMAHHKYHHLPMGVALQTLSFFVLFFAVHYVLGFAGPRLGYEGMADVAGFPLIALCGMLFGLILLPVTNALLRGFERQADAYAMRTATRPEAFIIALRRLGQLNLADQTPNPVIEWIFYSHPSIQNRIRHAEEVLKERQ